MKALNSNNKYISAFGKFLLIIFTSLNFYFHSGDLLLADDIELKNGKKYQNVKTELGSNFLLVKTEDGNTIQIPLTNLKKVKPSPVYWTKNKDVKLETSNTTLDKEENKNVESHSNITSTNPKSQIVRSTFIWQAAIPGWSGLIMTNYWYFGIMFSSLELYTLRNFVLYLNQPNPLIKKEIFYFQLNEIRLDRGNRIEERNEFRSYLALQYYNNNYTYSPNDEIISNEEFLRQRRLCFRRFLFAVFLDIGASYLISGNLKVDTALEKKSEQRFNFSFAPNFQTKNQGFDFSLSYNF